MSNIYIQEPPTAGKVLLETTVGDIEIELWSKEAPKASRNFLQLCMEGYYNDTIFHRVIKDFIVQGGDPTGTGHGGDSIYGQNFKDEIHSRLRFVRRGLVAMANEGEKNSNGSQFFFTLKETLELQGKHTIFGKVSGNTIFNVMKLQDGSLLTDDRPEYPHKIQGSKVLNNPFPDIVPRNENLKNSESLNYKSKARESNMKGTKNFKLLSFGDEAEEEEEDLEETLLKDKKVEKKGKSSHDLLNDPHLLKESGVTHSLNSEERDMSIIPSTSGTETESVLQRLRNKLVSKSYSKQKNGYQKEGQRGENSKRGENDQEDQEEEEEIRIKRLQRESLQKEIKDLKREIKGEKDVKNLTGTEAPKRLFTEEEKKNDVLQAYIKEQEKFTERQNKIPRKKTSGREEMTLALLEAFKSKLGKTKEPEKEAKERQTIRSMKDDEEDEEDENWWAHTLNFSQETPILAKDASSKDDDWFDIFDPRNPVNKRRRGEDTSSKTLSKIKKTR